MHARTHDGAPASPRPPADDAELAAHAGPAQAGPAHAAPAHAELAAHAEALAPSGRRHVPLRPMCAAPHSCSPAVRMKVLQQVPLLRGLSNAELTRVDARMTSLAWSEAQDVYRAGESAEHLYVLASGRAKAVHLSAAGDEHVVDLLAPGDLFGGLALLGTLEHHETVRAMTTMCALRVDTAAFRQILLEHPEVAVRALEMTAGRLEQARRDLTSRSLAPVPQRVAAVLLRLARKFGQRQEDGAVLIQVPLSRADIASIAGSTPESVSRAMSRWRTEGLIDSGRRWTEIRQPARLAQIAEGAAPARRPD